MTVDELHKLLGMAIAKGFGLKDVEVATSPRTDEWYEVADTEILPNLRGDFVFVINTD